MMCFGPLVASVLNVSIPAMRPSVVNMHNMLTICDTVLHVWVRQRFPPQYHHEWFITHMVT